MKNIKLSEINWKKHIRLAALPALGVFALAIAVQAASPLTASFEAETGTIDGCAAIINDPTASGGKAVRFQACVAAGLTPLDLDGSGTVIPDTNYSIPAGAIFMDDDGNDANAGTEAAPVKTLNVAISKAPNPGTIVVREGVYRDWYYTTATPDVSGRIVSKSLTFQAYPHEKAWFDGTDVVAANSWTNNGDGTWSQPWSTPSFCSNKYYDRPIDQQDPTTANTGPCYHSDLVGDANNPLAGDPQMLFINNVYMKQAVTKAEIANRADMFHYDHANRVISIGTSPVGKTIEITKRPNVMVLGGSPTTYAVKGLGFRRYATNPYSSSLTNGAVYIGGSNIDGSKTVIENNTFTANAGPGLSMRATNGVVTHNIMAKNGFTPMGSNGHTKSGVVDDLLIEANLVNQNNTEGFGHNCTASCSQAGIKLGNMNKFTVKNNIFENNDGPGLWCDIWCNDAVIINNIARNNTGAGIFYEISKNSIIASNLVYGNKEGIKIVADNTKIYNNTIVNNTYSSIYIHDDSRTMPDYPETDNAYIYNNIIYGGTTYPFVAQAGSQMNADNMIDGIDYNAYYRSGGSTSGMVTWRMSSTLFYGYKALPLGNAQRTPNPLTNLDGTVREGNGIDTYSPAGDPFFVNLAAGDYRVRSDSVAYNNGKPLPADVAAALGLSEGAVVSRGAVNWPGRL